MSGIIGSAGSKSGVIGTTELDYEEGTWTPELYIAGTISSVHNYNSGVYTRIGNILHLSFYWYHAGATAGAGAMTIKNLPFTSTRFGSSANGGYPALGMGYNAHSGSDWSEHAGRWQLNAADALSYYGYDATKTAGGTIEFSGYGSIPL